MANKQHKDLTSSDLHVMSVGNDNPTNFISNGDFESWSAGTSSAPDGWAFSGAGGSIAREATIIKIGTYSAKATRVGTDTQLSADLVASSTKSLTYWKGRTVTFGCWVYCDTASRAILGVYSKATEANLSSYHTGNSTWQWLTATHTIASDADQVSIICFVLTGNASAYFDGAIVVEGSSAFAFSPKPAELQDWKAWTSTLVWATHDPTLGTAISRFSITGKTCHFSIYIPFTDGKDSTGLTSATLPITPKDNNNYIACSVVYLVDATYTVGGAVIDALTPAGILGRVAPTLTNTKAGNVVISGSYEIA